MKKKVGWINVFCHLKKTKIEGCSTLLIQGPFYKRNGRTFLSTSATGGLTVEAALIVPFCTFIFTMLLYVIVFMMLYIHIQNSIYQVAASICQNAYLLQGNEENIKENSHVLSKEESSLWNLFQKGIEKEWIKNQILSDCIIKEKGLNSAEMLFQCKVEKADYNLDDGEGRIEFSYQIQIPFLAGNIGKFKIKQLVCFRGWVGKELSDGVEEGADLVYVTRYGEVYHTNQFCTYIAPSVKQYKIADNHEKDIVNGKRYAVCKYCRMAAYEKKGYVWISYYGDCYHKTSQCSAVNRDVFVKNKNKLEGMRECSKCAASH